MKKEKKDFNFKIIDKIEGFIYKMEDIETMKEKYFEIIKEYHKRNLSLSKRITKGTNTFTIEILKRKEVIFND